MSLSIIQERKEVVSGQGYVRPDYWLQLPYVGPTEQKFVGLFAVYDIYDNYVAFTCDGNYTVDWGDGVVENVSSGVRAEHRYDYSAVSSSTLCVRQYKQVIVTVTPQVGQNLTSINLNQYHSYIEAAGGVPFLTPWLHLRISSPNLTTLDIKNTFFSRKQSLVEQVDLLSISPSMTSFNQMFSNIYCLRRVTMPNTSNILDFQNCFNSCTALIDVSPFNTSNTTYMGNMFTNCVSLTNLPTFDISSVIDMSSTFSSCLSLNNINFSGNSVNLLSLSGTFNNCQNLKTVSGINYKNVTSMANAFNTTKITSLKNLNTENCTDFTTFFGSSSIKTIENLITSAATSFSLTSNRSLVYIDFDVISCNVNLSGCFLLSRDAIVNIFNKLKDLTSLPSKNINISFCFGSVYLTSADRLIATNKNWTITE
jgi:surface protein